MRTAWGDESGSAGTDGLSTYILTAVITARGDAPQVRDAMRELLLKGQRKLHWHDEQNRRRLEISRVVAQQPIEALVVVRSGSADEAAERRRRKCMEQLLRELDGCDELILESRGPADDRRDNVHLDALRRAHAVPKGLHTQHAAGGRDPGLWVADAVCGAVARDRVGDSGYLMAIETGVKVRVLRAG